jgi:hypothetical protein
MDRSQNFKHDGDSIGFEYLIDKPLLRGVTFQMPVGVSFALCWAKSEVAGAP